jgi:hypothetical protein
MDETKPKPAQRVFMKPGTVIEVEGIQLRLSYVNSGKNRLTFVPVEPSIEIIESPRDPIVGVSRG